MIQELREILQSRKTDAQKVALMSALVAKLYTYPEVAEILKDSLGKPRPGLPWDELGAKDLLTILRNTPAIPEKEWRGIPEHDRQSLANVLNHWKLRVVMDAGNHIKTESSLGKSIYNLRNSKSPKPETMADILQRAGLGGAHESLFVLDDGYSPNQFVLVGGCKAKLLAKPNLFQWWAEVIEPGGKALRLVEIADIEVNNI